jgi:nitrate reductase NapE component
MNHADDRPARDRMMRLVMLAVLGWGCLLATGVGLFGVDRQTGAIHFSPNLARGLVVLLCVSGFYGFWRWMLAVRRRHV